MHLFLFGGFTSISQDIRKADSLISLLKNEHLTESEWCNIALHIAHNHPNASVSLNYAREAITKASALGDVELQARLYEEIGAIQRVLGNHPESTKASLQALTLFEKIGRNDLKSAVLVQLGSNAVSDEDYSQAIEFFRQAMRYYESTNQGIFIAMVQLNMGEAYRLNDKTDSAVLKFQKSLSINDSLNHVGIESYALGNLGMTYNAMGKLEQARELLNQSLDFVNELGDPYTHAVYLAELALIDQKERFWIAAEKGFLDALQIAKDHSLKEQIRDISEMLVNYYKQSSDFEKALAYQEQFQVYQDSLVNKENVQELERVKANFEISQRDVEIAILNERDTLRRQQTFAAIGAMTLFLGLSLLLYRSNRAKQKVNHTLAIQKEEIRQREAEKALLLKELNHRVKNNLQMISSLLNLQGSELKGHPAEAAISAGKFRVDALALIHQKLYREDLHTTINLKDYVEELVLNLCYSFDDRLKPDLEVTAIDLSIDQAIPLALIVNEWVTNALKYAYEGVGEPVILVRIIQESNRLQLLVKDNGVGISKHSLENHTSFGLKLVYSLGKQLKADLNYTYDRGSLWTLSVPLT